MGSTQKPIQSNLGAVVDAIDGRIFVRRSKNGLNLKKEDRCTVVRKSAMHTLRWSPAFCSLGIEFLEVVAMHLNGFNYVTQVTDSRGNFFSQYATEDKRNQPPSQWPKGRMSPDGGDSQIYEYRSGCTCKH